MKQLLSIALSIVVTTVTAGGNYLRAAEATLHYLYRLPKVKTVHPPVVILLHGLGSNENDLFSFANALPDNFLVISARAPHTQGQGGYAWYQVDFSSGKPVANTAQVDKSRNAILQFLSQLKKLHDFDEHQVYLCGFSQGAIMSYAVALTSPDKIKGIAVLSGRLLEEVKPMIRKGDQLKKLAVFIGHGTTDNVLGFPYATDADKYLRTRGINAIFKKYPIAHSISEVEIEDLVHWLRVGK
jgi:phospholipase/carboxylesterase